MLNYQRAVQDVTPLWAKLISQGYPGMLYNGDADMACNFLGEEEAIASLNLPQTSPTTLWKMNNQVSGSRTTHSLCLTFARDPGV